MCSWSSSRAAHRRADGESVDLQQLYRVKFTDDAIQELHKHSRFKLTDASSIRSPSKTEIVNDPPTWPTRTWEFLDQFNREVRMSKAAAPAPHRNAPGRDEGELEKAEQRLTSYQVQHKTVALTPEMSRPWTRLPGSTLDGWRSRSGSAWCGATRCREEEIQIRQELAQLDRRCGSSRGRDWSRRAHA